MKENALVLSHASVVGPTIGWTDSNYKDNENKMLDHRFSVAPMMDGPGHLEKLSAISA